MLKVGGLLRYTLNIKTSNLKHWLVKYKKTFFAYFKSMDDKHNLLKPPDSVRNMKLLDKLSFEKEIDIPLINIKNTRVSTVLPYLKRYLLKLDNHKSVINESGCTVILIDPRKLDTWSDIDDTVRAFLKNHDIVETNFLHKKLVLKFENYSVDDVLRSVLPDDKEGMASFTKIGHIVHVNLREHLIPFKKIIGEVLLDKVSGCRTVVNKIDMIDNTYRNFQMEVLCGEADFMAKLKENKCQFEFDFSTVYWNSRLCTEHERIVNIVKPKDVFFDVFAGVGPFSIPIAKKKCVVFANDLNPESYKWLQHNVKMNRIGDNIKLFNKDGREFILNDLKHELLKYINQCNVHITMNLPALAVQFFNAFYKLYNNGELKEIQNPPLVYVYCFAKGEDYNTISKNLVIDNFGFDISDKIIDIFKVRTVSSMKEMMRLTIKLDKDILIGGTLRKRKVVENVTSEENVKKNMGKNKSKKPKNVFKVAGAKSLQIKSKAKAVTGQLKNINRKNKSKIQQIDKELVNIQDRVRQSKNEEKSSQKKVKEVKKGLSVKEYEQIQENSKKMVTNLDSMQI